MKYALFIMLFACLGCKKVLIKPLPVLQNQGFVYEGDYPSPLAGVSITSAVCKGSGTRRCDANEKFQTDEVGSFQYPEKTNVFTLEKAGYKTVHIDLRNALPSNVKATSDGIEVRMEH